MDNCCDSIMKYLVFFFNFIFFVAGIALLGVGIYIQVTFKSYFDFIGDTYVNASIVIIIVALIIFVVAFFGCCGACTENSCMMMTFAFFMALILIAELGVAITVYVLRGEVETTISENLKKGLQNYGKSEYEGVTKAWDALQKDFKCCGIESYKDWGEVDKFNKTGATPDSCCKEQTDKCGNDALNDPSNINKEGCRDAFKGKLKDNALIIGGIAIGFALAQVIGVIVSCCLSKNMKNQNQHV